ncbi:hypothetical protein ACQJBY_006973 [Aegilops geniculata]
MSSRGGPRRAVGHTAEMHPKHKGLGNIQMLLHYKWKPFRMPFTLGHNVQPQNLFVEAVRHPCYRMVAVQRQHRRRAV